MQRRFCAWCKYVICLTLLGTACLMLSGCIHKHSWQTVTQEPTCEDNGYSYRFCTQCNQIENEQTLTALGHDYQIQETEPSCTEPGSHTVFCTRCGMVQEETVVEALGHDYQRKVAEPTCEEAGWEAEVCTRCGDMLLKIDLPATGHSPVTEYTEGAGQESAYLHIVCSVCGEVLSVLQQEQPQGQQMENEQQESEDPADDYILPDSDKKYLSEEDVENLTWENCCLARNELYARHGRIFKTDEIRAYFEQKSWYEGTVEAAYFDTHQSEFFNDFEYKNASFLLDYEREKFGHSYY